MLAVVHALGDDVIDDIKITILDMTFDLNAAPRMWNEQLAVCLSNRSLMTFKLAEKNSLADAYEDIMCAIAVCPWCVVVVRHDNVLITRFN